MRLRIPALLAVVVLASACLETLEAPDGRFGNITVPTFDAGGGNYVLKAEAAFFDNTDASYTNPANDTCIVTGYNPNPGGLSGGSFLLRAGEHLLTTIGGRTDTLGLIPGLAVPYYRTTLTSGVPFVPGDTLQVSIPGETPGFPASAIFVRTAEVFTHDAVGVPPAGESQDVVWSPPPVGGSVMTVSLRYNNNFSTDTLPNEQVFCSFIDDGAAVIPTGYLSGWRGGPENSRSTRLVRVRSRQIDIDSRTRLAIISTFARPVNATQQ
jgi:hypothetical protein